MIVNALDGMKVQQRVVSGKSGIPDLFGKRRRMAGKTHRFRHWIGVVTLSGAGAGWDNCTRGGRLKRCTQMLTYVKAAT